MKIGSGDVVASIDMGTNSTRLLVLDVSTGDVLDRLMTITRLGEGVDATGELSREAIDRTLTVLRSYKEVMDSRRVSRCRAVATSAARDASNRDMLFNGAAEILGVCPELLSGSEEGKLSFTGAISDIHRLPQSSPCYRSSNGTGLLVVDIGGGSTEVIFGDPAYPDSARTMSLDIGCVRLTERCLHHDPPTQAEVKMARRTANEALLSARNTIGQSTYGECLIGLAGTVSTLGSLTLQLDVYDRARIHHLAMQRSVIKEWAVKLSGEAADSRLQRPGMVGGREDIIAGGAIVLDEAMSVFGMKWCLISESDILDGLAGSLI